MKLHHIAIWTFRLEELKEFYALPIERVQDRSQEELEAQILSQLKGGDL